MSSSSIALLLSLLDAPELRYRHDMVVGYHGTAGQALINDGFLTASDYLMSAVTTDDDDSATFDVEMDPERREFGYHSPSRGWMKVEKARLQCYGPDLARIFRSLLGTELPLGDRCPVDMEGALLFDLGMTRLLRQGPKSEVWYARRLGDPGVIIRIRAAIARRPSSRVRLLLTSTPQDRILTDGLPMMRIVPISDVLSWSGDRIDADILKARFAGTTPPVDAPLHLSEDASVLTIQGTEIVFGGDSQREAIRLIVEAHRNGKPVNAASTLRSAGFGSSIRTFRQAFKKQWPLLGTYLQGKDKLWQFEL